VQRGARLHVDGSLRHVRRRRPGMLCERDVHRSEPQVRRPPLRGVRDTWEPLLRRRHLHAGHVQPRHLSVT
jgi:hypothetical protein